MMITIDADKIKPNPIVQKTKDEIKELVQRLNYSDALEVLARCVRYTTHALMLELVRMMCQP